ncbi:MAG: hypothetical protein ACRDPF_26405 [Streptosporangiaceae bacterium]
MIEARKAAIGDGAEVRRLLPQRTLRTIGAWCFLDHYGGEPRFAHYADLPVVRDGAAC